MSENVTTLLGSATIAFATSFATMVLLLRTGLAGRLAIDVPNDRSLHASPVPRVGGIAVVAGILVALLLLDLTLYAVPVAIVAMLAVVSFVDDRHSLPIAGRLVVHVIAALSWLLYGTDYVLNWTLVPVVLVIAWTINLYNFMDGTDGLAGGMAVSGFGIFAFAAWQAGDPNLALMAVAASAASAAFLIFNFPPARCFMGDAGSVPLGFLAAAIGSKGWIDGAWPVWFPFMVFSPFIVDATITLFRRVFSGARFWKPHRDHYYQRVVQMGWTHRRLALAEYMLMLCVGVSALVTLNLGPGLQILSVIVWLMIYIRLMVQIDRRWRLRTVADGPR
ncbi:MAG: glycosyltransferase family 4 protein [Betaproteobacteria bacterium]|nr:MAG: glycosyltransferase family 4 protein [Betaproteobacteria bacterium]